MTRGLKVRVPPAGPAAAAPTVVIANLSDGALLDALGGASSRDALYELFSRHGSAVHRLASLLVAGGEDVDRLVEDVFVTLWRRSGQLEDNVENVRLGLLAMAWRRTGPVVEGVGGPETWRARSPSPTQPAAATSPLQWLPAGDREALALTVLAAATITEVAIVLQADRREVVARLRSGLRSFSL